MKENTTRTAICPRCQQEYRGYPALSRVDNETMICPDCGTREALESMGISLDEQEKILEIIHGRIRQE